MGIQQLAGGHDASAAADFLSVVSHDPKNYLAWYDLGVIAQQRHQPTQAALDYTSSLTADATYVPALFNLATLETVTHPTTAARLYEKAIAAQPNDAEAHLNLGFLFESLGEQKAGAEQLVRAVQIDPSLLKRVPSTAFTP